MVLYLICYGRVVHHVIMSGTLTFGGRYLMLWAVVPSDLVGDTSCNGEWYLNLFGAIPMSVRQMNG